jgi:hypothetical protein
MCLDSTVEQILIRRWAMSESETSRKAEVDRVKEAADRVARRMSQSFVLDPAKLVQFTPLRVSSSTERQAEREAGVNERGQR